MPTIDDTLPRPPRRVAPRRPRRSPSRVEIWAWTPLVLYRIALLLTYAAVVYFGVSAFNAGVPAFTITAPEGYLPIWAGVMILGALVAAVGAVGDTRRFHRLELGGAIFLATGLLTYVVILHVIGFGLGDPNRQAVAAGLTIGVPLVVLRLGWLISQLGRRRADAP